MVIKVFCKKDYNHHSGNFALKYGNICKFMYREDGVSQQNFMGAIFGPSSDDSISRLNYNCTWCFIKDDEFKEHFITLQELRKLKILKLDGITL